jgi:hypothetical protein
MRISTIVLSALVPLSALLAGCMNDHRAADRLPPPVPATTPTANTTVPEGTSPPAAGRATAVPPDAAKNGASSGAGLPPDPDKDKPRGNTPPGMDRSGGGPADGAIRDPAGAVTKQPEPKAPVQ